MSRRDDIHRQGIRLPATRSAAEAAEHVRSALEHGARNVQYEFTDPDDDWTPIWLIVTPDGSGTIITGNLHKHDMARRVGALARRFGAVALGHLHSSWMVSVEDVSDERMKIIGSGRVAVSDQPERREIILLAVYTAGTAKQLVAPIIRHVDRPPELGPFESPLPDIPDDVTYSGAMVDPLQEALVKVG